ncbi:hypothetical protein ETD83_29285 [Actinomadura soli]|uniref:Polysaccharide chain length determinant N-terminal domain-containing protein n=1 Tax=Actinomadura soli TaxID=2508997 RepID=A0A5C4J5G1_9ACTN|nr:hypothetical protein [Actinomadura soli]TMQ91775.1 hypothetical protein ETD83_29285 [Actinomadura soli]
MELSEYGRRHRAVVVPLTAVPIIAAAGGAGWAAVQPAEYRHSVEIRVPAPADGGGAALLEQHVSTYRGLVASSAVAAAVARETSVRAGDARNGLRTSRPQQGAHAGAIVRVTYTGTRRFEAPAVTKAAAGAAVTELMRPAMEAAQGSAAAAESEAGSGRRALDRAAARYGGLPLEEYRALQNQVAQLEVELDAPGGNRSPAEIRTALQTRKKRLAVLAPRAMEVAELQDRVAQADRKAADARLKVLDLEARTDAARASLVPVSAAARPVDRGVIVLRTGALSAGTGVLAAVGILVVVQSRHPRRDPLPVPPGDRPAQPAELP